jgi:ribosome biogenesis GTPase
MMQGIIYKGVGGFYYVHTHEGMFVCRGAGRLRLSVTPKVGDKVEFIPDGKEGSITNVLPRKNELSRPMVANVDMLIIVIAALPAPDYLLCDKLIIQAKAAGITPLIFANKSDLAPKEDMLAPYYNAGIQMLKGSAVTKEGLAALVQAMRNKICCMAGQSGVGKSSVLNAILPFANLETGEISEKVLRGRHTTRHTELIELAGGGLVADTPGFSVLNLDMQPEGLANYYNEFKTKEGCRFDNCMHMSEPDCSVKNLLKINEINQTRYKNYVNIMEELIELRRQKYD